MKKSATMLGVLCALVMILSFVGCKQPTDNGNGGGGGGTPPAITYTVGDTGPAGGKIFYVNPTAAADGWTYLEAALADLEGFFEWGAYDKDVGGTSAAIGSGKANTEVIIAALAALTPPETGKAAQAAKAYSGGGKDDWFLPSKAELNLMYTQKDMIGGFEPESEYQYESWYWSSSQDDNIYAFSQIFDEGHQNFNRKPNPISVRVIRSF